MTQFNYYSPAELRQLNKETINTIESKVSNFQNGNTYKTTHYFPHGSSFVPDKLILEIINSGLTNITNSKYSFAKCPGCVMLIIPEFIFTEDNINSASIMLSEIAKSCGCEYDHWDIEIYSPDMV